MSLALAGELLDLLGMGAAAVGVDICAVRMVVDHDEIGSQFAQDAGTGLVGGTICAVECDAERLEREVTRKTLLRKLDIAAECVVDAEGLADFCGGGADVFDFSAEDEMLDARFDFVIELEAVMPEEFDAVVFVGIVGGGKHDAGIGPQRAGDVGYARRWQWTDEECIRAERGQAGDDGIFQHVTREPCVLANDDSQATAMRGGASFGKDMGCGAAEFQRGLSRYGFDICDATNAVSSKKFAIGGHFAMRFAGG